MFRLDEKTALVTGAASGIGAEIASTFARAGAITFLADRDLSGAERMAATLCQEGLRAEAVFLDVVSEEDCGKVAEQIQGRFDSLNILVNNAGIGAVGTLLQTTGEDLDRLYSVNVRGVFNVAKAFLPGMVKAKVGNIINIASIGGVVGIRDRLAYCTNEVRWRRSHQKHGAGSRERRNPR
jgi:NAD(P)-dependent dehydrogenase (short-subunit alcohol dehydrogenase family)